MADAVIKKTYAATEAFFQDQNDQNQEFLDRINERQEEADCVSANTASKVVKRDASGNFAAGTITAALTGNAATATKATNIAGGAAGDMPYQSGADTTALTGAGTEGQFMRKGASTPDWSAIPYIQIREEQPEGTASGTFTSGSYQTRVLNTEVVDSHNLASVAANQITLAAGTYKCLIVCPGYKCNAHKARLYNITTSAVTLLGVNAYAGSGGSYANTQATITGIFTISVSTVFEVQHRCATTSANTGLGSACNFDDNEIYTTAEFWRIG